MQLQVQTDGQQDIMCGRFPFRISFSLVRCRQKDNPTISLLVTSLTFGLLSGKAMLTTGFIEQSVRRMIFDIGSAIKVEEEVEEEEENMVRHRWFCTSNAKSMLVKIVHPGGHMELHDSPVLAAEILHRNPKCCVAYPHVFQQPWAIVAPDTMLMLGEKFYVVPINTVRKLQRLSLRHSPSMLSQSTSPSLGTNPLSMGSKELLKDWDEEDDHTKNDSLKKKSEDDECFSKDGCLARLLTGLKIKDMPEEWSESSRPSSSSGSSDTRELMRSKWRGYTWRKGSKGSTKRHPAIDWRPNLESITEEKSASNL